MVSVLSWIAGSSISVAAFPLVAVFIFFPTASAQIIAMIGVALAIVECCGYFVAVAVFHRAIEPRSAFVRGIIASAATLSIIYALGVWVPDQPTYFVAVFIAFTVGALSSVAKRHAV